MTIWYEVPPHWPVGGVPNTGRRRRVLARLSPNDKASLEASGALALRTDKRVTTRIAERDERDNPSLHPALQDLAEAIIKDMVEACAAFDDPEVEYPGVDGGIEPVTDDHVALVIWAMQRELDRELRGGAPPSYDASDPFGGRGRPKRPAVPLAQLPWRVQRALAERRRLRYQQWGIGYAEWEANAWHPDNVPEDPEWEP